MSDRKRALEGNGESGVAKKLKGCVLFSVLSTQPNRCWISFSDAVSQIQSEGEFKSSNVLTRLYNLFCTQTVSTGGKQEAVSVLSSDFAS